MKKEICVGVIGIGARGESLLRDVVLKSEGVRVGAVCDLYKDRADTGAKHVLESGQAMPIVTTDYNDVINADGIDAVLIFSAWESHVEIAIKAMKNKKAVAMEVGGAYSIKQCWDLVDTYEETGSEFMFLENCCFGRRELMVRNMVSKGLFGEVVHAEGGYHHDLRREISFGKENRHYRLRNYLTRNCENYPTHELGPIAKVLNINNKNRLLSLTSTASKAAGLHDYILKNKPEDTELANLRFMQGDIVTTVIKCSGGETITLTLDTTLPRFYSRGFTVRGTNAMYEEATDSVFVDCKEDMAHDFDWKTECFGNAEKYTDEYDHPVWKKYLSEGVQGTHDGMDWLEFQVFFKALREGRKMPVDVYDAAVWMSITPLSEQSIASGSSPVEIPDFTRGKWVLSDSDTPIEY